LSNPKQILKVTQIARVAGGDCSDPFGEISTSSQEPNQIGIFSIKTLL